MASGFLARVTIRSFPALDGGQEFRHPPLEQARLRGNFPDLLQRVKAIMYPSYTRSERVADGSMHAIGVIGSFFGAALLLIWSAPVASPWEITAVSVYAITLIATFSASAFYHMTPWEGLRPVLRRIDHAAIYLKIAGTYTPLVVMIGSGLAYVVLAIVWAMAVIGMLLKLVFWTTPGQFGPALYLVMG